MGSARTQAAGLCPLSPAVLRTPAVTVAERARRPGRRGGGFVEQELPGRTATLTAPRALGEQTLRAPCVRPLGGDEKQVLAGMPRPDCPLQEAGGKSGERSAGGQPGLGSGKEGGCFLGRGHGSPSTGRGSPGVEGGPGLGHVQTWDGPRVKASSTLRAASPSKSESVLGLLHPTRCKHLSTPARPLLDPSSQSEGR